jgi:hypothetical protein
MHHLIGALSTALLAASGLTPTKPSDKLDTAFAPNAAVCVRFDAGGHPIAASIWGNAGDPRNPAMLQLLQSRSWPPPSADIVGKWVALSVAPDGSPVPEVLPTCPSD